MNYKIDYIPVSKTKRPGIKIIPNTLTIHSTANLKSTAKNERSWLTNIANLTSASFHIVVDENEAIEVIPLNEIAYHSGTTNGNQTSISLEICESGDREKTLNHAIEVTAFTLKKMGWGVDKLRQHFDWSGKNCPRILRDTNRWNEFVERVKQALNITTTAQSNIIKWNGFEFEVLEQTEKYKVLKFRSWGTTVYLTKTLLQYADVKTAVAKQPVEKLSSFYSRKKPKFIINGGLFAMNNGNTMAVLKDETGLYGDNGFYFDGYCMTVKNGKVEFVQLVNFKDANNYDYVIEVAPSLVKNGQVVMDVKGLDKGFITGKHPRQAIGIDNTFFYTLTTDGRDESECGMTIEQLACLCKDLGMTFAGNLDGGGSTKLYIDGKKINSMDEDRAVDNFVYVNIK